MIPVIFDVSGNTSYLTGGQNITVHGYGFNSPNITAKVAGVPCEVTDYSQESFSCTVKPASAVSVSGSQPGGYGVRRRTYNHTNYLDVASLLTGPYILQ